MDKTTAPAPDAPEQMPPGGGSYERQADGSLKKREGTEPATPRLATEPTQPE
jgi:hypothetical protein